ncbi:MAG: FG-GAP-like repeat-containing protein [Planctomycetota bacterium]|jgi:Flp pilus assembly protein TadD
MSVWKRRRVRRSMLVGVAVLVAVGAWAGTRRTTKPYVAGEFTEGLVDELARRLPPDRPDVTFTDVTAEAGLEFLHFPATRTNRLPEDMGSGVALGDIDGDGWTDVFLVNAAGPEPEREAGWPGRDGRCRLYRNLGDGRFEDVTERAGVGLTMLGMAAAFADVEGDGDLDLLVSGYGALHLFANDGTGRFEDTSLAAGLGPELVSGEADGDGPPAFWTGLAVGDYDGDDDVDLYVCAYVRWDEALGTAGGSVRQYGEEIPALINPSVFDPHPNLLLRNRGDGTFEDVAAAAGVDNASGRSLAATFVDLNGDGRPDLYVANDVSDNVLLLNRGDNRFEDATARGLVGDYRGAMGLAVGDFDGDLDPDLFITHWVAQENALYVNVTPEAEPGTRDLPFMAIDEADRHGLGQVALEMVGWATGFFDYDHDGLLDLYVVNGSTIPMREDRSKMVPMRMQLFWNAGPGRGYFDVGPVAGEAFGEEFVGRGGALFDYDLDGDQDLLVVRHGGSALLLRNERRGGHALRLVLRRASGNTHAIGSVVTVEAGGRTQRAELGTDGSYLSQHAVGALHFGLGAATVVDRVEVRWPDGSVEHAGPLPADSLVRWTAGETPHVRPFPGLAAERAAAARTGPTGIDEQKRFFALLGQASDQRVAGRHAEAVASFEEALTLWPGHEDCLYYLGNSRTELGLENEALDAFEQMVELHPSASRAWMQIGRLRLPGGDAALDDLAAAGAAFGRAHEINGEESGPVVQLGVVALLEARLNDADELFADAAALNSRSVEARYWRGYIAWTQGRADDALARLAEAHALAGGTGSKDASVSSEGQTASGQAMLAPSQIDAAEDPMQRWRSLSERTPEPDAEYGSLRLPGT